MERWLPSGVRKDQAMPYESSYACAIGAWKTPHPIYDCVGWVDGVYARATRRVRKEGTGRLLLKQEVHGLWNELLFAWKNMLCLGMGSPSSKVIHAELHHLDGIQDGPNQVYIWKACSHRKDRSMAGSAVRVRHHLWAIKGSALADYLAQQPIQEHIGQIAF